MPEKPVTPRKGQKPRQPARPGRPGRPKKDQHIVVRSEPRAEPDYRLLARAVIRVVLDEQRRAAGGPEEDDHDPS
ncbi:hypothetical protein [Raineyella sp. W15-4]|uniref:hypothetical protein n=1 Tax=Raineyella sp. W15-4 TaxID=3081651 RepID=UPI002955382D|nr:hypothetical protein [Raineyella sp. W15-4]WOQ17598.1 hypothetical protein R0145_02480 [Raineyella sp. W15-4]